MPYESLNSLESLHIHSVHHVQRFDPADVEANGDGRRGERRPTRRQGEDPVTVLLFLLRASLLLRDATVNSSRLFVLPSPRGPPSCASCIISWSSRVSPAGTLDDGAGTGGATLPAWIGESDGDRLGTGARVLGTQGMTGGTQTHDSRGREEWGKGRRMGLCRLPGGARVVGGSQSISNDTT